MTINHKIVLILGDATLTGAPIHALQIIKAIRGKDYKFLVICPNGPFTKKLEEEKIDFKTVLMRGPFDRKSSGQIREIVTDFNPDIIHCHGTRGTWLGLIATRNLKGIKKIYTEHLWTQNYHLPSLAYEQLQKRGLKFLSRYADKIIAVSKAVRDFLISEGFEKKKIILIPNGVGREYLEISPIKKPDTAPMILGCVGSLNDQKNYRMIIKAFYLLKLERPDLNIYLQIIGEGPLKKNLEEMVAKHRNINELVSFPGRVEDLKERYQHFTIFINCSISESFGLALAEAMAVGLPVIASRIPALSELVDDAGVMVDPKNKEQIKGAILRYIDDETMRNEMGQKAKDRIRKKFSEEVMVKKTKELYLSVIPTNKQGAKE